MYLTLPLAMLALLGGILAYDRWICRPRCWKHGNRPDFSSIDPATWEDYFHALSNVLEALKRRGFVSPFAESLCAWRMDRFERRLARAAAAEMRGHISREDFLRCHRVVAYLVRFAFPHSLHQTACITRLRKALDEDRVDGERHGQAREALMSHERRLGVLAELERRFGAPLPQGAAAYFYGLMLRWEAVFEEHGYTLHPDLDAWSRERRRLGF